eukprot:Unigene10457_Nuclearia_a/m.31970 Unigene10457_Nuclearia_a/g.31970  ORF Unigene10457_Nuclearia_a/g.31970 Unigene10457_Nuclearia_a/m.31970 type:complete len:466 (+) Unigene10457_Nuclearia_a:130-1527(+)
MRNPLAQAATAQEGVGLGVAAEEAPQHLARVQRAAGLEDVAPVRHADLGAEDALVAEARLEHVHAKDLAPQVAVVLRVIADHVAKGGRHVCALGRGDAPNGLAQVGVNRSRVGARARVDVLVKSGEEDLPTVEQPGAGEARALQGLEDLVWHGLPGLVVLAHTLERLALPDPVLEHLRRGLDKVALDARPRKVRHDGLRADLVHDVPKLVEQRLNLVVHEQRGLAVDAAREVGHARGHGRLALAAEAHAAGAQAEARRVPVLALARVQVKVEEAHVRARDRVDDLVQLNVRVPDQLVLLRLVLEDQSEQLLVHVEHAGHHLGQREVLFDLVRDLVARLLKLVKVVAEVPRVDAPVVRQHELGALGALELEQRVHLVLHQRREAVRQVLQEVLDAVGRASHADGGDVGRVRRVAEHGGHLRALLDERLEHRRVGVLAARVERGLQLAPHVRVLDKFHRGEVVWVLE